MRLPKSCSILLLAWASTAAKSLAIGDNRSTDVQASTDENSPIILADFQHHQLFEFQGNKMPQGLYANPVGATPESVEVKNGYLYLTVPGSKAGSFKSEVVTTEKKILYGSFRTVAIFSETPGVCNGTYSPLLEQ